MAKPWVFVLSGVVKMEGGSEVPCSVQEGNNNER